MQNPSSLPSLLPSLLEKTARHSAPQNVRLARELLRRHPALLDFAQAIPQIFTLLVPPRKSPGIPRSWLQGESSLPDLAKAQNRHVLLCRHDCSRRVSRRIPSQKYPVRFTMETAEALIRNGVAAPVPGSPEFARLDLEERIVLSLFCTPKKSRKEIQILEAKEETVLRGFFPQEILDDPKRFPRKKLRRVLHSFPALRTPKFQSRKQPGYSYAAFGLAQQHRHRILAPAIQSQDFGLEPEGNFLDPVLRTENLIQILDLPLDLLPATSNEWMLLILDLFRRERGSSYTLHLPLWRPVIRKIRNAQNQTQKEKGLRRKEVLYPGIRHHQKETSGLHSVRTGNLVLLQEREDALVYLNVLLKIELLNVLPGNFPAGEIRKINQAHASIRERIRNSSVQERKLLKERWGRASQRLGNARQDALLYFFGSDRNHPNRPKKSVLRWPVLFPREGKTLQRSENSPEIRVVPLSNNQMVLRHGEEMHHCIATHLKDFVQEQPWRAHVLRCSIQGPVKNSKEEKVILGTLGFQERRDARDSGKGVLITWQHRARWNGVLHPEIARIVPLVENEMHKNLQKWNRDPEMVQKIRKNLFEGRRILALGTQQERITRQILRWEIVRKYMILREIVFPELPELGEEFFDRRNPKPDPDFGAEIQANANANEILDRFESLI